MIEGADRIVESARKELSEILVRENEFKYGGPVDFLPIIEEDYGDEVRNLGLEKNLEEYYLNRVGEVFREFSENSINHIGRYYFTDLYRGSWD
ncbi:hypothetical protein HOD29_00630 [archaeon]|jgi:hypothetical protein|nr:hypothetical protein [archaeon]